MTLSNTFSDINFLLELRVRKEEDIIRFTDTSLEALVNRSIARLDDHFCTWRRTIVYGNDFVGPRLTVANATAIGGRARHGTTVSRSVIELTLPDINKY